MKKRIRNIFLLCLIVTMLTALAGCGDSVDTSDLDYGDSTITISGLENEDFTVTINELAELEAVKEKADAQRYNGEEVKFTAVGPTLNTFLEKYGKTQTDFSLIRFTASDNYAIAMSGNILEERDIILSYLNGNDSLTEEEIPLRVIVPGERAMYWIRMVDKIEFETGSENMVANKVVFLDNILPALEGTDDEEQGGMVVATEDMLETYGGGSDKLTIIAGDGLQKKETLENFSTGFIKYTGDKAPKFYSPELPEGMHVDGVESISCGDVIYYDLTIGKQNLPEQKTDDKTGVTFKDIVKDKKFGSSKIYKVTGGLGDTAELTEDELSKALFIEENDSWSLYIDSTKTIKKVMIVEAQL